MNEFFAGATTIACAATALYFLKFWRRTGDRLFAAFSLAFAVFAVNRVVLTVLDTENEGRVLVYVARLAAFLLIIAAIVDKNRPERPRR